MLEFGKDMLEFAKDTLEFAKDTLVSGKNMQVIWKYKHVFDEFKSGFLQVVAQFRATIQLTLHCFPGIFDGHEEARKGTKIEVPGSFCVLSCLFVAVKPSRRNARSSRDNSN